MYRDASGSIIILYSAGELCPIMDITQNGRRFVGTKINPHFLLSAMGSTGMNLLVYITNILT